MFYFRLDRLFIRSNGVRKAIKRRDKATVYIYSFVSTNESQLPDLDGLTSGRLKKEERKAIIEKAIASVVSGRKLTPIENVRDEHELTFGDTGIVLHQSKEIPRELHWQLAVIGSKQRVRSNAQLVHDVINDDSFDGFTKDFAKTMRKTVTPQATAFIEIGKYLTNFILKFYTRKNDDQLGLIYQSWNRKEHYPHAKRLKDGVPDLTKNMVYDYSMFGYENVAELAEEPAVA